MNKYIKQLLELQAREFEETISPESEKRITWLRARVPAPILAHYDRLCDQGKKGVAGVRHQVCTGCHIRVPIGTIVDVTRADDVHVCESCGRYLYIVEEPAAEAPVAKAPRKTSRKQLTHAL
jgi:predicted  nucleic acid-binding Zn-ribbon protein